MGRFKGGLRCKGRVNCVITNVVTFINYSYNYMQVFSKYKYNEKSMLVHNNSIVSNF